MGRLGLILVLLMGASCARTPALVEKGLPQELVIYYFYDELCASCDGLEKFNEIAARELEGVRDRYPYTLQTANVYIKANRELYTRVTDEMGLDRGSLELPLLIIGGRVFQGYEAISRNLREMFLVAGEDLFINRRVYNPGTRKTGKDLFQDYPINNDHLTLVYFYRITCDECNRVKPLIDALPAAVSLGDRDIPLDIIRINTRSGNNNERVAAFFEEYQVPDDDRMVPIIFLSHTYLAGAEAIESRLQAALIESSPGFRKNILPDH
jgi:glutaredoxin